MKMYVVTNMFFLKITISQTIATFFIILRTLAHTRTTCEKIYSNVYCYSVKTIFTHIVFQLSKHTALLNN